jgi:multiple sugar transport system substrate-binding protein
MSAHAKRVLITILTGLMIGAVTAQSRPFDGETITFASMNDPFAFVIEEMLPLFTEETGIEVRMDIIPYVGLRERTLADLVSGTGTFDVITMDIVWMGEWAEAGFIRQLDDLIERDEIDLDAFLPGALDGLAYWQDEIFGMPIGAYHFLMHYRKDLLEEAGLEVPTTYDELLAAAEALSRPDEGFYGIAAPMVRGAPVVHYSLAYLSGAGGGVFDAAGNVAIDSDLAKTVYEYYKRFLEVGPPGMLSYDWFAVSEDFQQNRVAFLGAWTVVSPGFEDPDESLVDGNVGYTTLPLVDEDGSGQVPFGGWSLVLNQTSRKQEAAWEFVKWLVRPDTQKTYAQMLGTPVLFETLEDPELQAQFPWYPTVLEVERAGAVDAQFRPRTPEWPQMEEVLGLRLNQAMTGELNITDALDGSAEQIRGILGQ